MREKCLLYTVAGSVRLERSALELTFEVNYFCYWWYLDGVPNNASHSIYTMIKTLGFPTNFRMFEITLQLKGDCVTGIRRENENGLLLKQL